MNTAKQKWTCDGCSKKRWSVKLPKGWHVSALRYAFGSSIFPRLCGQCARKVKAHDKMRRKVLRSWNKDEGTYFSWTVAG